MKIFHSLIKWRLVAHDFMDLMDNRLNLLSLMEEALIKMNLKDCTEA